MALVRCVFVRDTVEAEDVVIERLREPAYTWPSGDGHTAERTLVLAAHRVQLRAATRTGGSGTSKGYASLPKVCKQSVAVRSYNQACQSCVCKLTMYQTWTRALCSWPMLPPCPYMSITHCPNCDNTGALNGRPVVCPNRVKVLCRLPPKGWPIGGAPCQP